MRVCVCVHACLLRRWLGGGGGAVRPEAIILVSHKTQKMSRFSIKNVCQKRGSISGE